MYVCTYVCLCMCMYKVRVNNGLFAVRTSMILKTHLHILMYICTYVCVYACSSLIHLPNNEYARYS